MPTEIEDDFFDDLDFADNPEPRCPCVLLLDTSTSMKGEPIDQLNRGLEIFKKDLSSDSLAAKRVEVAIVSFGPVTIESNFITADRFKPPTLRANGRTPIGSAIITAIELIERRKQIYKSQGIPYYRPWIFLISDGTPTDRYQKAALEIQNGHDLDSFVFFAVGVSGADMKILGEISARQPLMLKDLKFRDLFMWLSKSMRSISLSSIGDRIDLDNPIAPEGWAHI